MAELAGLHTKITGDASGLASAAKQAIGLVDQYGRAVSKTVASETKASSANERLAASYRKIKANIDPAFAATQRFEKVQSTLTKAHAAGIISQKQLNTSLQQAATAYKVAGASSEIFNKQIRSSRFHTANLAAQFNDIGVMLAAGQSPMMLAVQQGTQITQVLQVMGGTGRQQLKALAQSFLSIINPTALMTIGIIAGGAALIQWGVRAFNASEDGGTYADVIERLDKVLGDLKGDMSKFNLTIQEQVDKWGEARDAVIQYAAVTAKLRIAEANQKFRQMSEGLADVARSWVDLNDVTQTSPEDFLNPIVTASERIQEEFGVTNREAVKLEQVFADIVAAATDMERTSALAGLNQAFTEMGVSADKIPSSLRQATIEANDIFTVTAEGLKLIADLQERIDTGNLSGTGKEGSRSGGGTSRSEAERFAERMAEEERRERERLAAEVERILEEHATKLELEQQFHDARLQILMEAREKELITQQEYDRLSEEENRDHNKRLAEIDRSVNRTRLEGAANFFGDLASAMASGNEKMLRISRVFGAAQALINSWIAFSEVLKTAEPWYIKIPAALAVLAAGLNAVSAIKSVGKGGGQTSASGVNREPTGGGTVAQQEAPTSTSVNISLRGQNFDRGAVIGLIEQINEAVGDGARIRAA